MNVLTNSRILVTGAGGFIGSNLVDRLVREGARVRGLCRYNSRADRGALEWLDPEVVAAVEIIMGDLRDIESVTDATADTDTVIHLGAQVAVPYSYTNPRDFVECNVTGTLNVAQAALAAGVKRLVYGPRS
jgi:nucleoside-diphosphate-sugar epimerase